MKVQPLTSLKLTFDGWGYKTKITPQAGGYRKWIKGHLPQGHGIVWMIMLSGGRYPVYPSLAPYGFYSHVEPVFGLYTNRDLSDTRWYDDGQLATSTDVAPFTYYRRFGSLVADVGPGNTSLCGQDYVGYACIYKKWSFGWAITEVKDGSNSATVPVRLAVDSSYEPQGTWAQGMVGTLAIGTVDGPLNIGTGYTIYRRPPQMNIEYRVYREHKCVTRRIIM